MFIATLYNSETKKPMTCSIGPFNSLVAAMEWVAKENAKFSNGREFRVRNLISQQSWEKVSE